MFGPDSFSHRSLTTGEPLFQKEIRPLKYFMNLYQVISPVLIKKCIVTLFLVLSAIILFSGCTTGDDESFRNPSPESGVNCWWWWLNGNVDAEAITSDLEAMKEKGFQGAVIFDAGGHNQRGNRDVPAGPRFGSPEWTDLFVFALDEAERLGLEMSFNIQSGWNLGGPVVTPEHAAKYLTYSEKRISGGGEADVILAQPESAEGFYKDIAVLAVPLDAEKVSPEPVHYLEQKLSIHELGGSAPDCRFLLDNGAKDGREPDDEDTVFIVSHDDIADVSSSMDAAGRFRWDAPEGEWAILRFGYTCTGAEVSTSSDTWKGLVLDYLSTDAIDFYLEKVVEPILIASGHHVGAALKYMETDSWECGGMNWTDRFIDDFLELNGYDILPYLPAAAGYVVDDMASTHAFLADFRKTVGYDVAHNHYGRFSDYAHSHGMGILPESSGPHAGPFDGVRNYSFSDIVMSEFWAPSPHRPRDSDRFFLKQASSAAHIYGKKIVGAESFTTIGPHWNDEIWSSQKPAFDHEICAGLNRVYFHTFTCSPQEMGLPGQEYFAGTHINPRLTWWDAAGGFIDYMHRVQSVVQGAQFCGDVLYYYGDHIPVIYPYKHSDMAGCMPGFDYDVTCEDALLSLYADAFGNICTLSGMKYRVLVLPDHKVLSLAALEKVEELLRGGATVLGPKPECCVSLKGGAQARERFFSLADSIWGEAAGQGAKEYGEGTVVWGARAGEYLLSNGIRQDFSVAQDPGLENFDFIHYRSHGCDIYFISSFEDEERMVNCTFRVSGKAPELWDAMDGSIREAGEFSQENGCTTIPLRFEPCGSAIVVFDRKISADACGDGSRNYDDYSICKSLEGPWNVAFDPRRGGPESTVLDTLSDWTLSADEGIRYYSGPAVYSCSFDFDADTDGQRYFIALGSVKDAGMASVSVNGKKMGTVWTKPFRLEITGALRQGKNDISIEVINSWYNRVAGDQLNPDGTHFTSTNINLAVDYRGRPAATIELSPSGLLGPVDILKQMHKE